MKRSLRIIALSYLLGTIGGCDGITPPQDVVDAIDILTTIKKVDLDQISNLVVTTDSAGTPSLKKEDSSGVLVSANFLDDQSQNIDTSDVFPVAMRLLNKDYLYLVLGSEKDNNCFQDPAATACYTLQSNIDTSFEYKKQRHFLVRLTDGAMFHFDAAAYGVEITVNMEPGLYGNYSWKVNDTNIYFVSGWSDYGDQALFKLDTSDPANLTASRISFDSDKLWNGEFLINSDGELLYRARNSLDANETRFTTPTDTGFVTVSDTSGNPVEPFLVCPDDTLYLEFGTIYTADTSTADVTGQIPPGLVALVPSPFDYVDTNGFTVGFNLADSTTRTTEYRYYNSDNTFHATYTVSHEGDVWRVCGGTGPSRLDVGAGIVQKHMSSNGKLYVLSNDGTSSQLRQFDPVAGTATAFTSTSYPNAAWTDFQVNGVDEVTLFGSDAGSGTASLILKINSARVETIVASEADVPDVQQVVHFF